jgi:translation elongation factor IF5A
MSNINDNLFFPIKANNLKINSYVLINNHPCKIIEMTVHKTGKHGTAKIHIIGIDIFDNTKHITFFSSSENVMVPIINKIEYQFVSLDEEYVNIMSENDNYDVKTLKINDEDMINKLIELSKMNNNIYVTILCAMNNEKVIDIKTKK